MLASNGLAWATTLCGALACVGFCAAVGRLRILPARLSRKLMHIVTGPLYMLTWPLYTAAPASPFLAASVPALAGVQFALVGAGLVRDDTLVAGTSRSGRREELLRGPLLYAAAHVAATLLCWRHSPGGVLALSALCGGDGLAEVVGRGCSSSAAQPAARGARRSLVQRLARPLPHNRGKTLGGSLACWLGGAAAALPLLMHFQRCGMYAAAAGPTAALLSGWALWRGVLLCSAVGAAAESLPLPGELDNVSIVLAVGLCSHAYFGF